MIESVREGYLLHYGEPRVIVGADADLRLLAGDYLYALGLERLAGLGDLPAVRELSDLISIGAQLHADGAETRPAAAGEALWLASTMAIATGEPDGLEEAKFALRAGNPGAERGRAGRGDLDGVGGGPGRCACGRLASNRMSAVRPT